MLSEEACKKNIGKKQERNVERATRQLPYLAYAYYRQDWQKG